MARTGKSTRKVKVVVVACSGGSRDGQIADLAARKISADGACVMCSMARIASQSLRAMESLKRSSRVLVIDGCRKNCAQKALKRQGIRSAFHVHVSNGDHPHPSGRPLTVSEVVKVVVKARLAVQQNADSDSAV